MSVIPTIIPTIVLLLSPFLIILAMLILYLRGARYIFLDRIWFLIQKTGFHDGKLQAYHDKQLDLERFKFMHRIPAIENIDAAHAAKDWADKVGLSLRTMGKARLWVDWEKQQVKRPKTSGTVFLALLFTAVSIATTIPVIWATHNDVLVRFSETKSWAWVGENKARSVNLLSPTSWNLTTSTCTTKAGDNTPLSPTEKAELCGLFNNPAHNSYISDTVTLQRWVMGPLSIIMLCLDYLFLQGFAIRLHAIDIKRVIENKRAKISHPVEKAQPQTPEAAQPHEAESI